MIHDIRVRVVCLGQMQALDASKAVSWGDNPCSAEVLFYADVASDLKQLKLFYDQGLVDYMAFNAFGLLIPPVVTMLEAFEWSRTPSPELSFFQSRIQSEVLQKIIIVAAVASQSHVLLLVMLSIKFRSTPGRIWIGKFGMLGWSCCRARLHKWSCGQFQLNCGCCQDVQKTNQTCKLSTFATGFEFDLHFGFSGSTCFFHMIPHVVLAHLSS